MSSEAKATRKHQGFHERQVPGAEVVKNNVDAFLEREKTLPS